MSTSAADRRIRSLRGRKPEVDPWKAHGALVEKERRPNGLVEQALTVFLAGAECPFTCSFCDLWRYTIDGPTPQGALPHQIEDALRSVDVEGAARVKLYNASNFFDRRAVPIEDLPRIAELCAPFSGVTVESHASTIGPATLRFAEQLSGAGRLEVAMGLETIHPDACTQLNKRLDLERFDRACDYLTEHDIDLRVFVLLGAPGILARESVEWTVRSVEYAARRGAAIVSIIPVRGGNGEMERLASLGLFTPPTLRQLEDAFDRCVTMRETAVTVDLWDIERLATCAACREERTRRLKRLNLTGRAEPPIACAVCDRA
ncbi:MAG TPA: radical SAM protein [Gemmatimonadaceae bacterium]|nr:radical SAM protein [Gemmatimonadaceae bacterium]